MNLAAFAIGKFPVTNAEWRCFMEAGGYEEERWWETDAGQELAAGQGDGRRTEAAVAGIRNVQAVGCRDNARRGRITQAD